MSKFILLKNSGELIKHTGTIHIINSLSLLERKIYNILLHNARSNIQNKIDHFINLNELKKLIGRGGNRYDDIKRAIKNLVKTSIEWNVLGMDNKNQWGISTFLASAEIKKNICTYDYSSALIKFLANPNVYARLSLPIQKEFSNKHALVLWEFLHEQLCVNKKISYQTKYFLIDDIRKILGAVKEYSDFKTFNRDVLKKAVKEINSLSDIEVEIFFKKEGKRITAISFLLKMKGKDSLNSNLTPQKLIRSNFNITNLKQTKNEDIILRNLKQTLIKEFKISESKVVKLLSEYELKNIEKSLKYVRDKISQKFKIINIAAYTTKAVKEGWMQTESSTISKAKTRVQLIAEAEEYLEELEDKIKVESWYNVWINLKSQMDILEFKSWIAHLNYEDEYEGTVRLYVDNSFIQKEIKNKYGCILLSTWQEYNPKIKKIEIQFKKF